MHVQQIIANYKKNYVEESHDEPQMIYELFKFYLHLSNINILLILQNNANSLLSS